MFSVWNADVIVPLERGVPVDPLCLENILEWSGPHLGRLIVVHDTPLSRDLIRWLDHRASVDTRLIAIECVHQTGTIGAINRGLSSRKRDAVIVSADCVVRRDWLAELSEVAHAEERTACVSPLTNGLGTCSLADFAPDDREELLPDVATVAAACAGLPRWTVAPTLSGHCLYLRGDVVDAVGLLDMSLPDVKDAVTNWIVRAQMLGFQAKRANHVYVPRQGTLARAASIEAQPRSDAYDLRSLNRQLDRFDQSLDGHLATHAVRVETTGKLPVALDIRHLPREHVGTRTYAVCLAQALADLSDIELTLLVNEPAQASGLRGRVVCSNEWQSDVALIHRPAQVFDPADLTLLYGSSAHVMITYQDLIGYQIPLAFATDGEYERFRATSDLSMPATQKVLAISENAANEITGAFGIPREEITVVAHGVEAGWFAHRDERDATILWEMGLPSRYFFSLATDFPHKNLPNLLSAYALLRQRWTDGDPPGLVLAGYTSAARTNIYSTLGSKPLGKGLIMLGPVSRDQLRVLYQNAEALVYPSLYEGFGLPPLEAMSSGTPVIAMRFSSVPEVAGDAALYTDGLSVNALARAMEDLANDESMRADLRTRGLMRIEQFRWEKTARETADAYRSTVLRPSERSLMARRHLREAIMRWSSFVPEQPKVAPVEHHSSDHSDEVHATPGELDSPDASSGPHDHPIAAPSDPSIFVGEHGQSDSLDDRLAPVEPIGIRNACRELTLSIRARLRRDVRRFKVHDDQPTDNNRRSA